MSTPLGQQHVPDILDSLAQLSSDEVPTPPKVARAMLDILPTEVWSDSTLKWLDPCSKSGVFLREIASRLLEGLAEWEPEFEKRREHIFRSMLYGTSITEMTGVISRRTVYCSRDASGPHSIVRFDDEAGNLPFIPAKHTFGKDGKAKSCDRCRTPLDLERGDKRENYAYSFIHAAFPTKEMKDMKFDVVVGNPPYQVDSAGNTRTMPVYHLFVKRAIELDPRYVLMITPSRWFAGGLGMADFRARMLSDRRIRRLVDYRIEKDAFPGVNINGGVSYFLWDRLHDGPCLVSHVAPGGVVGKAESRFLDEFDLLVRQNESAAILRKIRSHKEPTFESNVSPQKPFDFHTNFHGASSPDVCDDPIVLHGARRQTWVSRSDVVKNQNWIDQWKVLVPAASDGNESFPAPIWDMAVGPFVAGPAEVCSGSYLAISPSDDPSQATRTAAYLRTRLVRFLISLRKIAQHNTVDRFAFVPDLPMDREWTDELLYERYGLTDDEIAHIESQIKEMPAAEQAG